MELSPIHTPIALKRTPTLEVSMVHNSLLGPYNLRFGTPGREQETVVLGRDRRYERVGHTESPLRTFLSIDRVGPLDQGP